VASHDAKCHEVVGRPTIRVRGRSDFLEDVLEDALEARYSRCRVGTRSRQLENRLVDGRSTVVRAARRAVPGVL
jgi:hypothetical protein